MASRGSSNTGPFITIFVMGVALLVTFILTVMFYGQAERARKELAEAQQATRQFLGGETSAAWADRWLEQAQNARQPVIAFMNESFEEAMRRAAGDPQLSITEFRERLETIPDADTAPLSRLVTQRDRRIAQLQQQLSDANAAVAAANADLQAEVDRVERLQANHTATVAALNDEIGQYKSELDRYRSQVDTTISQNDSRVADIRREAADRESDLQERIAQLQEESLRLQGQLSSLRDSRAGATLLPTDEYALVDGRIVGVNAAQNTVFIDLGRRNRMVLGMSFEVYDNSSAIRPDSDGNYPPGKGTIEVIRVNEGSSVARIVRESRGNPIVDGDVIANALYDPDKIYHFVVFGNFDASGDGVSRPEEANAIKGVISEWGGRLDDDISGRTDFLVLGDRPILPPQPASTAPGPVILEYIRKRRVVDEYDRLFEAAIQANIPVLNQNRLYTLTGIHGVR